MLIVLGQVQDMLLQTWKVLKAKQLHAVLEEPVLKRWGELLQTKCLEEDLGGI